MSKFEFPEGIILSGDWKDSPANQPDYVLLLQKYFLSKWYYYVVFGILCLGLAYYFYKKQQPLYEISGKLLIREREQDYGPAEDFVKRNITFSTASEKAINEIEMLTSASLMNKAVEELGLGARYYFKEGLAEYDAYPHFPIVVDSASVIPLKDEDPDFEIRPLDNQRFEFWNRSLIGAYSYGETFSNRFGTFRILRNDSLPLPSDSSMHIAFQSTQELAGAYLEELKVTLSDDKNNSSVLVLSLRDAVPQRGIDVMNRLVDNYNELKGQVNTEITLKTLDLIDNRLSDISAELSSAEGIVEQFKLSNEIAGETTSDLNITLESINELAKEQRSVEIQINLLQSMKRDLQDTSSNFELIPANLSLFDGRIVELIRPYNEQVLERERLLLKGQPSNPVIQSRNQRLKSMRASIYSALQNMEGELMQKLDQIGNQHASATSRLRSVPRRERGLLDKQRTQSIKEDLYVYLLQKREETALALVSNYVNALMIDPPHSTIDPVAPNKIIIFMTGALGGGALPFLILVVSGFLVRSVRTEKDLKQILPDKEVLGVIHHYKGKNQHVWKNPNSHLIVERFRSLRANLQFQHREDTQSLILLVTSSTGAEGKTFVATNLAASFASAKFKTLVIDFDLRKPSLSRYFEEKPEIGLSNYLQGELEIQDIIQVSNAIPNLHFIASGPLLPNPAELLNSRQLELLFSFLKGWYDIIIVDTSPIGIVSDAILLSRYVDHSLYVVRSGVTTKGMVEKAREMFDQNKLANPSIIFNGVKKGDDEYGYSYKNYGFSNS